MEPEHTREKRSRSDTDYSRCLICQHVSETVPLQQLTPLGYPALLNAVTKRMDEVAFRLERDIIDEHNFMLHEPKMHAKCRNSYTNRKTVEQKIRNVKTTVNNCDESSSSSNTAHMGTRSSSEQPIRYKHQCFICCKERDKKGEWKLLLITDLEGHKPIQQKARSLHDEVMLKRLHMFDSGSIDIVAADFRYHRSCMTTYMNKRITGAKQQAENDPYNDAFEKLISEIEAPLFLENKVFYITTLRNQYRTYLTEHGVSNAMAHKSFCLKRRLLNYYQTGDICKVRIVPQKGTSSLICSSSLSIGELLAEVNRLKQDLTEDEYDEESDEEPADTSTEMRMMSFHSAKKIRIDLKNQAKHQRQQIQSARESNCAVVREHDAPNEMINHETSLLPTLEISTVAAADHTNHGLYNYLAWLLTDASPEIGQDGKVPLAMKQHEQVLSLAQDISAGVAGLPTPKHVGIALHILKETRSKETVTLLNRFGNSISYQDAQRYITTMAMQTEDQINQDGFFMPSNLRTGQFTHCAFDNLDFHEYTKDGRTLHGTTHIVYQSVSQDDKSKISSVPTIPLVKSRRTSIEPPQPVQPTESFLTLKDRQQSRSLVGLQIRPLLPEQLCEQQNQVSMLWNIMQTFPTLLLDEPRPEILPPTWSGFHHLLTQQDTEATLIGYGPFIPQSPTSADVVEKSVEYCMEVTQKVGQEFTVVTCDQAIYEIVLGLQKKKTRKYEKLILRMGGFHIAQNYLGAIGCLMKGSGIEDILVEADICLRGTANKIMSGKDYYAMLRAHSLINASMFGLHWEAFERWLVNENRDLDCMSELSTTVLNLMESISQENAQNAIETCNMATEQLRLISSLMAEFDASMCHSPTYQFWLMYMDMVNILKRYIHAERAGIWDDHLSEVEKMLPYLVAAGHYKYVSCLPHYLAAMRELNTTAPEVAQAFKGGLFTVRQTSGKFNGVWSDMALEQTYNRDAKTQLFHGISQQPAAMEKYLRALPKLTSISEQTKRMVHIVHNDEKHHEDSDSLMQSEMHAIKRVSRLIQEKMINPFETNEQDLLNISTGQKAISVDLINARKLGMEALTTTQAEGRDKVPSLKLQTFASKTTKTQSVALKSKIIYQEESVVARNLYFIQDLDEGKKLAAFTHEWTAYPSSLFEPDPHLEQGYGMRKGNKSDYLAALKKFLGESWRETDKLPPSESNEQCCLVVDAMAFLQRYQRLDCDCFNDLERKYQERILTMMSGGYTCVHFVGDRYDVSLERSLKGEEREKREKTHQRSKEYEPRGALMLPEWNMFIQNPQNKANLLNYIGESWLNNHARIPANCMMILGGLFRDPGKTVQLTTTEATQLDEISCQIHEEADTRMFAHIAYSVQHMGYKRIVVQATDTDVVIMCIYYSTCIPDLEELWVQKMDTFIPTHEIAASLARACNMEAEQICSVILSAYILSGCDTVSYPFQRGKKRAFKCAVDNPEKLLPLAQYGKPGENFILDVSTDVIEAARFFFLALYTQSDFLGSLDVLRAHIFATKKCDLRCLPPTEDAFYLHLLRSLHQMAVCKSAHISKPVHPIATAFGREIRNGKLVPIMMTKDPKPRAVQEKFCKCKKSNCLRSCLCARANSKCVFACLCMGDPLKCGRVEANLLIPDEN